MCPIYKKNKSCHCCLLQYSKSPCFLKKIVNGDLVVRGEHSWNTNKIHCELGFAEMLSINIFVVFCSVPYIYHIPYFNNDSFVCIRFFT